MRRNCEPQRQRGCEAGAPHAANDRREGLVVGCQDHTTGEEWCGAKIHLQTNDRRHRLCIAAMRSLTVLSAFLDVSSLNLAAPRAPPFFQVPLICGPAFASPAISLVTLRCTVANPGDRSMRPSSI